MSLINVGNLTCLSECASKTDDWRVTLERTSKAFGGPRKSPAPVPGCENDLGIVEQSLLRFIPG